MLHKYGCLIGLYENKFGPFGGLTEVIYSNGAIEGHTWDLASTEDIEAPLKRNILFSLKKSEYHTQNVCLPYMNAHIGAVSVGKRKGTFTLLCFNPKEHAQAVWKDFRYDQEIFDYFLIHGKGIKKYRHALFRQWRLKWHQQKLISLSCCFDASMLHERLIFQQPRDVPELMPDGICPKQLVTPGLFKRSDKYCGVELLYFMYWAGIELRAIKVTGNGYTPAQTVSFVAELNFPVNVQEPHKFEDLIYSDLEKVQRECPISDIPSQTFTLPQDCQEDAPSDMCYARYLGQGLHRYPLRPLITLAHVMVFDEDTVGVLWVEQECFTLCKRVHQTFKQHHL
ncbi:F-box only protein 31-B-like isoform X2 [Penaeus monodon]|uniref:F-box only protein 31-B-like isoform X2 n=1 Tax=Penaeus monodon TaxID=6687 RepID=UPI0018A7573E|nr:F-box only protein 31-B-like isoform X2 [Penaeus monodon]